MEDSLVKELRPIIINNKRIAINENISEKPLWDLYGNTLQKYERQLGIPEDESPLVDHVNLYEANGRMPYVLDVGGDLSAIRSQRLPGIAIGLGNKTDEKNEVRDNNENRNLLSGDILLPTTWRRLNAIMKEKNIPDFALIVSCMNEGLLHISENPDVHFRILQEMWDVLSSHNGMLAIQTTTKRGEREFYTLPSVKKMKQLNLGSRPGIKLKELPYGFIMIKEENAPSQLPTTPVPIAQEIFALFAKKK